MYVSNKIKIREISEILGIVNSTHAAAYSSIPSVRVYILNESCWSIGIGYASCSAAAASVIIFN